MGQVLHFTGTLAAQRGDYDKSTQAYSDSFRIRERLGDLGSMAALLSNLGIVAEYRGDYPAAKARLEEWMRLNREVGETWMVGHGPQQPRKRPLGALGEYVEACHECAAALDTYRAYDDEWALAIIYEDVALLAGGGGAIGAAESCVRLIGAADALRDRIGSPRRMCRRRWIRH